MAITHTEIQTPQTYVITFTASSSIGAGIMNILVKNSDEEIVLNVNVTSGTPYQWEYTYGDYGVTYTFTGSSSESTSEIPFEIFDYIPRFTLPAITCKELGTVSYFAPNITEVNNHEEIEPVEPIADADEIEYKLYYFDSNTNSYVLERTAIVGLTEPVVDNDIRFSQDNENLWIPNKLTMMKFVVTVRNQSTAVTKEITFPICGSWKIRRMSCGKYRVYNYTLSTINYNIYDSKDVILESATSPSLSYDEFNPTTDGVFKLTTTINGEDLTAYIFNFCELEKCIVELQQKVLLENVCDECKMDKVLYQKALRLIPIYETWKKLLDKDNIYSIQYTSTDQSNLLADIYNSEELYKEIKILCDACSTSKKCNC